MLKLKLPYFGHLMRRADLFEKTLHNCTVGIFHATKTSTKPTFENINNGQFKLLIVNFVNMAHKCKHAF